MEQQEHNAVDLAGQIASFLDATGVSRSGDGFAWNGSKFATFGELAHAMEGLARLTNPGEQLKTIRCSCCGNGISRNADACPSCGEPNKRASLTREGEVEIRTGSYGVGFIIGLVGLVAVFIAPPLGLFMLMVAGALFKIGSKKVQGLIGPCPNCSTELSVQAGTTSASCNTCKKPFAVQGKSFVSG